jgi:hypothetical protein
MAAVAALDSAVQPHEEHRIMILTERLQLDSILTGRTHRLVHNFCDDAWDALPKLWTITHQQVLAEAERRGWECFVSVSAPYDDFLVIEEPTGFVSCSFERGELQQANAQPFPQIETAVRDMLTRRMRAVGLTKGQANEV